MKTRTVSVSDNLSKLQVGFKRDLIREVKVFVIDAVAFREDWEKNGPAVPGLIPVQAVDRLKKFTQMFDVRARKWCVEWAFPNHDTLFTSQLVTVCPYIAQYMTITSDCLLIHITKD
jgi:hypothetical protein